MKENKTNVCTFGVKAAIAIVLIIAVWPVLEIVTNALVAITTFAIGMGLAFVIFVAVIYPYWDTDKGDEKREPSIEKDIRNRMTGAYDSVREYLKNKKEDE